VFCLLLYLCLFIAELLERVCVYCLEAAIQIAVVNLKTSSMMGLTKSTTEKAVKQTQLHSDTNTL